MQLLYFNWNALRTICAPVAGRPQFNSTDPQEPTTFLDKFQSIRRTVRSNIADRPQFNPANPTRDNIVSGQILISTADCPLSNSGPSAVQFCEIIRDNVSGQLLT